MDQNDRNELTDLLAHLGLWLDEKRFDEAPAVFTEDASVDTAGGTVQGIDALIAQARRGHPADVPTQHFITGPLIDVHGDRATIRANLLVVFVTRAVRRFIGERYHLETTRTAQGWRISRVRARPVWEATHA